MKIYNLVLASVMCLFLINCGNRESTESKEWTQEYKKEYLKSCFNSAKKAYIARGLEPDRETIKKHCMCVGRQLEEKFTMEESGKLSKEKMKEEVFAAAAHCK